MIKELIDKIAYVGDSIIPEDYGKIYYSKIDGSYLTRTSSAKEFFEFLLRYGITEQVQSRDGGRTACIGFNPKEQKWYGWSHRAVFGFGIGSECKKGSCGYSPSNKEDFIENELAFWDSVTAVVKDDGILMTYKNGEEQLIPYPEKWGKGEWTATTLEEAKEMAIDFARGVS